MKYNFFVKLASTFKYQEFGGNLILIHLINYMFQLRHYSSNIKCLSLTHVINIIIVQLQCICDYMALIQICDNMLGSKMYKQCITTMSQQPSNVSIQIYNICITSFNLYFLNLNLPNYKYLIAFDFQESNDLFTCNIFC